MWEQTEPMQNQVAKLMGPTWGPPGSCRPQLCPWYKGKFLERSSFRVWVIPYTEPKPSQPPVQLPGTRCFLAWAMETQGTIVDTMVKSWFEERGNVGSLIIMLQESGYKQWFLIYRRSPLLGFGNEKTVGKFRYDSCGRRTQGNQTNRTPRHNEAEKKVTAIFHAIFADAFSWMKSFVLWSKFHWISFLKV